MCNHPWTAPVFFQSYLIVFTFWQYGKKAVTMVPPEPHPAALVAHTVDGLHPKDKKAHKHEKKQEEEKEKEKELEEDSKKPVKFSSAVTLIANAALNKENTVLMQWVQNLIQFIADTLEYIYGLFMWQNVVTTQAIILVLFCTTVYSCFRPFLDVVRVVGMYLLLMWTHPVNFVQTKLILFIFYLIRAKVSEIDASKTLESVAGPGSKRIEQLRQSRAHLRKTRTNLLASARSSPFTGAVVSGSASVESKDGSFMGSNAGSLSSAQTVRSGTLNSDQFLAVPTQLL